MSTMTDTNTPAKTSRLAIGALVAGIIALLLLATQPYDAQVWTGVVGVFAIVFAVLDLVDARRAQQPISLLAAVGAILATIALVCAFAVWPAIH